MASRVVGVGGVAAHEVVPDCLVSSMAAHSSPRGSTPAAANASAGTGVSTLPNCSRPRAVASRRAGSTVSTSTLPPEVRRPPSRPSAAAVGGLADAARAAGDDDLLGRQQLLDRAGRLGLAAGHSVAELLAEGLGDLARGPHAVASGRTGTGTYSSGRPAGSAVAERARGARPGVRRSGDGQLGGVEDRLRRRRRPRAASCGAAAPASRSRSKTSSSPRPNSSGSTRLTTTAARSTVGLVAEAAGQLDRLGDRHLLRRGHDHQARSLPGRRGCRASSRSGRGPGRPAPAR